MPVLLFVVKTNNLKQENTNIEKPKIEDNTSSMNNKRIAKNTLLLYLRMLLTMGVSLYTSRIVLNALGVEDFGIYNVVGGVVAMFSMLSGSLSAATSRFLTFELGRKDLLKLKKVFSTSVTIHIVLAFIIVLLAESIGVWFLNHKMNIPVDRLTAANWVLQCSIFTFAINLISIPYNASIIAHEKMNAFAYISILQSVLKLAVVYLLLVINHDKLIIYALLLAAVALVIRLIYTIYCKKHFEECHYCFVYDKAMMKEISSFAGWNMIGASSAILRGEGTNILINIFSGSAVNAARGISFQVNNAVSQFVQSFMTAVNPQITKSYASGDHKYMMTLVFQGARFSFYLLLFLSLPILIKTDYILTLWLKVVPDHTILFVRLILVFSIIESLSNPLVTAMLATGNIRKYQIIVGGFQMMNFPVSWLLLKLGFFPEITIIVFIFFSLCCLTSRLVLLKRMIHLQVKNYIKKVLLNVFLVSIVAIIIPTYIAHITNDTFTGFMFTSLSAVCITLLVIYFIGLKSKERAFVLNKVKNINLKMIKR